MAVQWDFLRWLGSGAIWRDCSPSEVQHDLVTFIQQFQPLSQSTHLSGLTAAWMQQCSKQGIIVTLGFRIISLATDIDLGQDLLSEILTMTS